MLVAITLLAITLLVALIKPVTYTPVVANTAMLLTPPTVILALPFGAEISMAVVPLSM